MVNLIQNEFDDFREKTKNVSLFAPVPGHQEEIQEPIEHVEENEVHLLVYDIDHRDEPEEYAAHGPVSVLRVLAFFYELKPYFCGIIGSSKRLLSLTMKFITQFRLHFQATRLQGAIEPTASQSRTGLAPSAKRNLNSEYLEGLILPFNCCLDYKKWTRNQLMEFLSQMFTPSTTMKLVVKISTGSHLSRFQDKGYFEELNKEASIINEYQFSNIQQEIEKLNRFQ
ncbi:unnamed protein product [Caenorhabditis nigoni]